MIQTNESYQYLVQQLLQLLQHHRMAMFSRSLRQLLHKTNIRFLSKHNHKSLNDQCGIQLSYTLLPQFFFSQLLPCPLYRLLLLHSYNCTYGDLPLVCGPLPVMHTSPHPHPAVLQWSSKDGAGNHHHLFVHIKTTS